MTGKHWQQAADEQAGAAAQGSHRGLKADAGAGSICTVKLPEPPPASNFPKEPPTPDQACQDCAGSLSNHTLAVLCFA